MARVKVDEIKARFKTNVVQTAKFSELLQQSLTRYRKCAVDTAQVIEELIEMAKKFREAAQRGESAGTHWREPMRLGEARPPQEPSLARRAPRKMSASDAEKKRTKSGQKPDGNRRGPAGRLRKLDHALASCSRTLSLAATSR